MPSYVKKYTKQGHLHPPAFLAANLQFETFMGSHAYGVASETSDLDFYGFCIPPKEDVFPHLKGEILGFGRQHQRFEQYQEHHVAADGRDCDFSIYSIVKYFQLAMDNNPNMVDSLFVPVNCITHITTIGQLVRDNRRSFLHKGAYHKFRGYAYAQLSKIENKQRTEGVRKEIIEKYGYDVKFAYHIIRLLDECEQILSEGDLDLRRSQRVLMAVRSGEWSLDQVKDYFARGEKHLEELYHSSQLPYSPDAEALRDLLLQCLEMHYGSLAAAIVVPGRERQTLEEIHLMIAKVLGY